MFTVSINPTYLCNFSCDFCYLTPEQLKDNTRVDLDVLAERLAQITANREITHVDLYGGEVTTLPEDYIEALLNIISLYYGGKVNVITNLSRPLTRTEWLLRDDIDVSVSWDYTCREGWDTVMKNIAQLHKNISVLMLASKCMVNWNPRELGAAQMILNALRNVRSVEIKPYSPNQANQDKVTYKEFEEFIKRWVESQSQLVLPQDQPYEFVNETLIMESIIGARNAYSDDHIYITPEGKFAVLEFDLNDNEYFMEVDSFEKYEIWACAERKRVRENKFCSECPYMGTCLSEHLRDVKSLDQSCNGFRHLLEWYDDRLQIATGDVPSSV